MIPFLLTSLGLALMTSAPIFGNIGPLIFFLGGVLIIAALAELFRP